MSSNLEGKIPSVELGTPETAVQVCSAQQLLFGKGKTKKGRSSQIEIDYLILGYTILIKLTEK
jgi:hypothetical protein